jgi:nitrogen PTS system EIIA component
MQIDVTEAAKILDLSEKEVYRLIHRKELPASRINEQYLINRSELLEWATSRNISFSTDIFANNNSKTPVVPGLADAITAGGIHYKVKGVDRDSIFKATLDLMPLPADVDRKFLLKMMIAREKLGTTAMGNGIALPHVRNPIVMRVAHPMITLCFLDKAIDFQAIDGKPVHTMFVLVSPTVSTHLGILSRIAFALHQPDFSAAIAKQAPFNDVVSAAKLVDQQVSKSAEKRNQP